MGLPTGLQSQGDQTGRAKNFFDKETIRVNENQEEKKRFKGVSRGQKENSKAIPLHENKSQRPSSGKNLKRPLSGEKN